MIMRRVKAPSLHVGPKRRKHSVYTLACQTVQETVQSLALPPLIRIDKFRSGSVKCMLIISQVTSFVWGHYSGSQPPAKKSGGQDMQLEVVFSQTELVRRTRKSSHNMSVLSMTRDRSNPEPRCLSVIVQGLIRESILSKSKGTFFLLNYRLTFT